MLSLDSSISGVRYVGFKPLRFSELTGEGRVRTIVGSNAGAIRIAEIASGMSRVGMSNSLTTAIARLAEITGQSDPEASSSVAAAKVGHSTTVTAFRASSFTVIERKSHTPWQVTSTSSSDPTVAEIRAGDYVIAAVHTGGGVTVVNEFAWLMTAAGIGAPDENMQSGRGLEESRLSRLVEALSASLIPTSNGFVGLAVTQTTSLSGVARAYRAESG